MAIVFTQASGLNDGVFGKIQAPLRMMIEQKAEAFQQKSLLDKLFFMDKGTHFAESISSMTGMDDWEPVGENGPRPKTDMQEGYRKMLQSMTWKSEFEISAEAMEDSQVMDLRGRPTKFTNAYYRTRENFGHALFGAAINGQTEMTFGGKKFDATAADGLALFSKVHTSPVDKKLKQSNQFSNPFSEDALGLAETAMQNFLGDKGEILSVGPDTIVIPNDAALKKAVLSCIGADKHDADSTNGFNYQYGRWNVIIDPYLNRFIAPGVKPWILLDSAYNQEYVGAWWVDRLEMKVHSYLNEKSDANVWAGRARFSATFNDWRAFCIGGIEGGTELT